MLKIGKDAIVKFLREDLPVLGVDLIIGGVKLARDMSDKAAELIADGTIPAPGFVIDMAREKLQSQEDFYRVAEPEHGWDKGSHPDKTEKDEIEKERASRKKAASAARKKSAGKRRAGRAKRSAGAGPAAPEKKRTRSRKKKPVKSDTPPSAPPGESD
jgi:hypothetical protein